MGEPHRPATMTSMNRARKTNFSNNRNLVCETRKRKRGRSSGNLLKLMDGPVNVVVGNEKNTQHATASMATGTGSVQADDSPG
jgi:hypothetical protein